MPTLLLLRSVACSVATARKPDCTAWSLTLDYTHVASMVACAAKHISMYHHCTLHILSKSLCKVRTSIVEVHICDVSMRQMACRANFLRTTHYLTHHYLTQPAGHKGLT